MSTRFLFTVLLTSILAIGCASVRTVTRPVFNDRYTIVSLESHLDQHRKPISMGFDHPAEFTDEEMARILGSVQVVVPPGLLSKLIFKTQPEPEPAFTPKEAEAFGKPMAKAFREATPDERIVFFFHHQRTVYKGTTTTGVAFIKDKHLNFLLGRYYMGNQPGSPDIPVSGSPFPNTNEQNFYLVASPYETIGDGKTAPGGGEVVYPKRWLIIDYATLLNPPPPTAETPAEPEEIKPKASAPPSTLEEKLKILNKLKEDGLITEEDFEQKKKELLEAF